MVRQAKYMNANMFLVGGLTYLTYDRNIPLSVRHYMNGVAKHLIFGKMEKRGDHHS